VHPIAFKIGSFEVHWYGVFLAIAFLSGIWTAGRRGARDGLAPERIVDLTFWLLVGALVGARGLYLLTYWREEAGKPILSILFQRAGLVFYGGLIGGTVTSFLYLRARKLAVWKIADALAPSIALGYVFGRMGCLMTGCCYGRPTDVPWAIHFPKGHETYPLNASAPLAVHPTQIYDAILNLILYGALAWLHRRKKFDGQVFATYLICYAVTRSVVEVFRGDYKPQYLVGVLTPAHLVSMVILAAGLLLFWKLPRVLNRPA
jgi:phosphatidylglycerol:prolipoprotein diacylglycerol transferase